MDKSGSKSKTWLILAHCFNFEGFQKFIMIVVRSFKPVLMLKKKVKDRQEDYQLRGT